MFVLNNISKRWRQK